MRRTLSAADRSTAPLHDGGCKLHADDTPIPVLAPGNKKTKTGRFWVYVRDDRRSGSSEPAAVWFAYSPDRKGIHPQTHLAGFKGILQADAYAGFNELTEGGKVRLAFAGITRADTYSTCMRQPRRTPRSNGST